MSHSKLFYCLHLPIQSNIKGRWPNSCTGGLASPGGPCCFAAYCFYCLQLSICSIAQPNGCAGVLSAAWLLSRTPLSLKKRQVPLSLVSSTPPSLKRRQVPLRLLQGHHHLWKGIECRFACFKDTVIFEKALSAALLVSRTPSSFKKRQVPRLTLLSAREGPKLR